MCGGAHYGEAEGVVSVERWSCSRGASCVVVVTDELVIYLVGFPLPDVEGGCLEVLNGLFCEDVLGVGGEEAPLAPADGLTDPPLAMDGINLGPVTQVGGIKAGNRQEVAAL